MKVEVVRFPNGYSCVYVGGLQVGRVVDLPDGRIGVDNCTPTFKGFSFTDDRSIVNFVETQLKNADVDPSSPTIDLRTIGVRYDRPF